MRQLFFVSIFTLCLICWTCVVQAQNRSDVRPRRSIRTLYSLARVHLKAGRIAQADALSREAFQLLSREKERRSAWSSANRVGFSCFEARFRKLRKEIYEFRRLEFENDSSSSGGGLDRFYLRVMSLISQALPVYKQCIEAIAFVSGSNQRIRNRISLLNVRQVRNDLIRELQDLKSDFAIRDNKRRLYVLFQRFNSLRKKNKFILARIKENKRAIAKLAVRQKTYGRIILGWTGVALSVTVAGIGFAFVGGIVSESNHFKIREHHPGRGQREEKLVAERVDVMTKTSVALFVSAGALMAASLVVLISNRRKPKSYANRQPPPSSFVFGGLH